MNLECPICDKMHTKSNVNSKNINDKQYCGKKCRDKAKEQGTLL